jgi:amidase
MWGGGLPDDVFDGYVAAARGLDPRDTGWAARIGRAAAQSLRDWQRLLERRERMRHAWEAFFQDYDVLLCPVMTTLAFPHDTSGFDHTAQLQRTITVNGKARPYLDNLIWPGLVTLVNLPATALPTGKFVGGLPCGVQAVSAFLEDRTTLGFAQRVEDELGGYVPPDEARLRA